MTDPSISEKKVMPSLMDTGNPYRRDGARGDAANEIRYWACLNSSGSRRDSIAWR